VEVLRALDHPSIVRHLDAGVELLGGAELAWLAMQWCEGVTLREELREQRGRGGRTPAEVLSFLRYPRNEGGGDTVQRFKPNTPTLPRRFVCTETTDFANPIEPSGMGGRKIAEAIARATGAAGDPKRSVVLSAG